jgi:ubiquinone/menaquinone biosynthesis C-methylase UbiE
MSKANSMPDSDLVYSICYETFRPQLVRIALLLDLFSPLADGPADAQTVASACGCDPHGVRALLDYLSHLQLLERRGNAYALTPTGATFFVRGARTYAGDWVLMETGPEMWEGILGSLRSGQPSYQAVPWVQDAWLESYRPSRIAESPEMWRAAGIELGQHPGLRVLDVACGCGVKSLVLAQADPSVHVTCVDSTDVLEVTRDLAGRLEVLPQVTFLPGDLQTIDLGADRYDAALLGQITYILAPEQNVDLFRRLCRALLPGGTLVIDVFMTEEEPNELGSQFTVMLRALTGGAAHSFAEYRTWLEETGYGRVEQLSDKWLSAHRPD